MVDVWPAKQMLKVEPLGEYFDEAPSVYLVVRNI